MSNSGADELPATLEYEAHLVQHVDGWGYEISCNGQVTIVQHYHPDKPGNTAMTEAEAQAFAKAVISRL